jgi:HSP20 family molecular chaperone IbpA
MAEHVRRDVIADSLFSPEAFDKARSRLIADLQAAFKPAFTRHDNEESTVLEFSLAGYSEEQVKVTFDPAAHKLRVRALQNFAGHRRSYNTEIPLLSHVRPEDIKVTHKNGLLTVTIARGERIEESPSEIVIPLNQE